MYSKLKNLTDFTRTLIDHFRGKYQSPNKEYFYWNGEPRPELEQLVNHLSNPLQPERIVIRTILRSKAVTSILDAACGPAVELDGYLLEYPQIKYTGIDRSAYMLHIAQQKHPSHNFIQGDIHHLPFSSNTFDSVLLKHILEHLPDYKKPIEEALRVAQRYVLINFFQPTTPLPFDVHLWSRHGYWQNWYSKDTLHTFFNTLPIQNYELHTTQGTAQQTAEIYVLKKR